VAVISSTNDHPKPTLLEVNLPERPREVEVVSGQGLVNNLTPVPRCLAPGHLRLVPPPTGLEDYCRNLPFIPRGDDRGGSNVGEAPS
jgi:hypothetical protein